MTNLLGVVIPTVGTRLSSLKRTVASLNQGVPITLLIVGPKSVEKKIRNLELSLPFEFVEEKQSTGAANAIAQGLAILEDLCTYITWIGDDDMFAQNSIRAVIERMETTQKDFYFGHCEYIDTEGLERKLYKPSRFFRFRLRYWWNPIPQPGSWFSSSVYKSVGGLNTSLRFAFDQDLWHRIHPCQMEYVRHTLGIYSLGPGTLSHDFAKEANFEAAQVRLSYLPGNVKPFLGLAYKLSAYVSERLYSLKTHRW